MDESKDRLVKNFNEKDKTVLIVDDALDDLESMRGILEINGYNVLPCDAGVKALEDLGNNKVDLIIMDIMMPTLSGYDLLRIFRERLAKNIPIIFVSIKEQREVDLTNVDGFIQKPFDASKFAETINKAIKNSGDK